jgi:hypothetical protein
MFGSVVGALRSWVATAKGGSGASKWEQICLGSGALIRHLDISRYDSISFAMQSLCYLESSNSGATAHIFSRTTLRFVCEFFVGCDVATK